MSLSDSENGLPSPRADKVALDKPTFCGTIAEARYQRREVRARKPQPWVVRKLMVVVTLGIMGYTAYVYSGRFAVRLMHGGRRREGGESLFGLLVGWSVLYAWMVWAYVKIRPVTPPAAHVPGTTLPLPLPLANGHANGHAPLANGQLTNVPPPPRRKSSARSRRDDGEAAPAPPRGRFPPTTAALLPPHRWCSRCAIVKPYRAHHCRVCGTCVLKFDHHCPWIGQCVGARNHKFFLNFALATALFTLYTFASLLAFNVPGALRGGGSADPQEGVVIGIAALFALFTLSLGAAHTRMILLSQTTVESLGVQRMKEREGAALAAAGVGCLDVRTKRAARVANDAEWGAPDTEGNLWWPGGARAGWEDVMGRSVLGWIFPIGRPLGDGLHYRPNPRFDTDGRWRRRAEWPVELR
ncbi:DHHC palmitoyltransferase-domain-containing protein [Mycena rosella]|uniref:Palmitoyltransferase n=1 Tax=Mycena rosella TaxID=1033263 RepID=A0AAD7CD67_MYCRO|nr:DHHC palmitoyltransferase-domain-containing protein [Mycena rosella]